MRYSVLTSGSCGNSYAFYDGKTTILIDVGLTLTGLKRRLVDADIPYTSIKALFLTHLHPDHVKGAGVFNRDSGINVHLTKSMRDGGTSILCKLGLKDNNLSTFDYGEKIVIDNFVITSFSTSHDSQGSCGYKIENGKDSFFLMTDTGIIPEAAEALAKDSNILFIESNYDDEMLEHGKYPYVLKRRVRGDRGHLSNEQAHDFIINSKLSNKSIYLIHVSENNNSIEKLNEMVSTLPVDNRYIICERGKSYWE